MIKQFFITTTAILLLGLQVAPTYAMEISEVKLNSGDYYLRVDLDMRLDLEKLLKCEKQKMKDNRTAGLYCLALCYGRMETDDEGNGVRVPLAQGLPFLPLELVKHIWSFVKAQRLFAPDLAEQWLLSYEPNNIKGLFELLLKDPSLREEQRNIVDMCRLRPFSNLCEHYLRNGYSFSKPTDSSLLNRVAGADSEKYKKLCFEEGFSNIQPLLYSLKVSRRYLTENCISSALIVHKLYTNKYPGLMMNGVLVECDSNSQIGQKLKDMEKLKLSGYEPYCATYEGLEKACKKKYTRKELCAQATHIHDLVGSYAFPSDTGHQRHVEAHNNLRAILYNNSEKLIFALWPSEELAFSL